ncbi:hypothetical protein ACWGOQ_0010505 [Aquimarina sp. M1]
MKHLKSLAKTYFLILGITLVGCSGDDDVATTRIGFFPNEITQTISTSATSVTTTFTYNDNNQIIRFESNESGVSLEYNDNGLISQITEIDDSGSYSVVYNGDIVDQLVENTTNDIIEVDYVDGTYSFDGGSRTFDADNRLIDTGGTTSITYNTSSGPFEEVDFQPVLFFLGGSSVTTASYFFSKNEVTSFSVPLGGVLQCTTHRDTDGNIDLVIVRREDGEEVYRYVIAYEERVITN